MKSLHELKKAIVDYSNDLLGEYRKAIKDAVSVNQSDERLKGEVLKAQCHYFYLIFGRFQKEFSESEKMRMVYALSNPQKIGLPSKYVPSYYDEHGLCGGALFAILNYVYELSDSITLEQLNVMQEIDKYQVLIMGNVWKQELALFSGANDTTENRHEKKADTTKEQKTEDKYKGEEKQNDSTTSQKPKTMYCRKCGHKLAEGSKFCNECGVKVIA